MLESHLVIHDAGEDHVAIVYDDVDRVVAKGWVLGDAACHASDGGKAAEADRDCQCTCAGQAEL